ncbi:hypothetical protein EJ02DRAFT_441652 [Clathrospora elynae]|uniref:Uncharacterized protein n=1 Tax=Clathrospora elynae TaxID=706981 RepID=A0A6A5T529_9PLEO|nr:hypothetical protein EJ02DRAFT_441652 [Clathrospora elynae]
MTEADHICSIKTTASGSTKAYGHTVSYQESPHDDCFFKSLQVHALIEGIGHAAILYSSLGDNTDTVLATLNNLNTDIAYVHQGAFKAMSLLRVDACKQRDMADLAIDKTTNSAINLIQAQPLQCQDAVANAWVKRTTIIADAVCVCLNKMRQLEDGLDDFVRLEYPWNYFQSSVDAASSAFRRIFSLMATPNLNPTSDSAVHPRIHGRNLSVSSASSDHEPNARGFRASMSAACPTRMLTFGGYPHTILTTIAPTLAIISSRANGLFSPFK